MDSATMNVSGGTTPYTYSWSNSSTGQSAYNLSSGTYICVVTDGNSCTFSAKVSVTQPAILRDSIASSTCNTKTDLGTITAGVKGGVSPYTYSWAPSGGSGKTASGLSAGSYTVTVTDKNGCVGTSNASVSLSCLTGIGGGPKHGGDNNNSCCDLNDLNNLSLYPNPNTGEFNIKGLKAGMIIELYNTLGQLISRSVSGDEDTQEFNISAQPNGIYLIKLMSPDGTFVIEKKVVKTW